MMKGKEVIVGETPESVRGLQELSPPIWESLSCCVCGGCGPWFEPSSPAVPSGKTFCQAFFSWVGKPLFSKLERRKIYDMVLERVEKILASISQLGKSAREAAWRIAAEFWFQSW